MIIFRGKFELLDCYDPAPDHLTVEEALDLADQCVDIGECCRNPLGARENYIPGLRAVPKLTEAQRREAIAAREDSEERFRRAQTERKAKMRTREARQKELNANRRALAVAQYFGSNDLEGWDVWDD